MIYNYIVRIYPLFRVMEVQRTCEVTATPIEPDRVNGKRVGRCQPERGRRENAESSNKRI